MLLNLHNIAYLQLVCQVSMEISPISGFAVSTKRASQLRKFGGKEFGDVFFQGGDDRCLLKIYLYQYVIDLTV